MKIHYLDEYGVLMYSTDASMVPCIGQTVIIADEDFRIKNVSWAIEHNYVIVELTQNIVKSNQKEESNSGRLAEMNNAILAITKRQDATEKKGTALNEQIVTIRKHINQATQQSKKD
jgi:hypothetical protein